MDGQSSNTSTLPADMEGKILLASQQASQVAKLFSPQVSQAIELGVAAEPIFKGFAQMFISIFHHHTGVPQPANPATR